MKEQEKKKEPVKPNPKQESKSLSGTPEKSTWEQAAETIAGNNKLMEVVMKILLSPITLVIGTGALIYCFFKIKGQNEEIKKLKEENTKLLSEKAETEEEYHKVKKKFKKLKELNEFEHESTVSALGFSPKKLMLPSEPVRKKTYNTSFLD